MKIAIFGTRGIPNHHGGFEQFAEFFSKFLVDNKHDVYVFNSYNHPYKEKMWKGVKIVHCYDPEYKIGSIGQFIYDFNCVMYCRRNDFDIILQLGYTSSSIWSFLFPRRSILITNMDGLEWKRSKYGRFTRFYLKYAEKWGAKYGGSLVADSIGIQNYLQDTYNKKSTFIAYGASIFDNPDSNILIKYNLKQYEYSLLIARFEPENNIEMILDGIIKSNNKEKMLVIGRHDVNKFGALLKEKYKHNSNIKFLGAIYNLNELNNLRHFSNLYYHGHSVGGTNPSLLEAMSSNSLIVAHDNIFNRSVLQDNAFYFRNSDDVKEVHENVYKSQYIKFLKKNKEIILKYYNWEIINKSYLTLMNSLYVNK